VNNILTRALILLSIMSLPVMAFADGNEKDNQFYKTTTTTDNNGNVTSIQTSRAGNKIIEITISYTDGKYLFFIPAYYKNFKMEVKTFGADGETTNILESRGTYYPNSGLYEPSTFSEATIFNNTTKKTTVTTLDKFNIRETIYDGSISEKTKIQESFYDYFVLPDYEKGKENTFLKGAFIATFGKDGLATSYKDYSVFSNFNGSFDVRYQVSEYSQNDQGQRTEEVTSYYPDGNIKCSGSRSATTAKKEGIWTTYYLDPGKKFKKTEQYKNGELISTVNVDILSTEEMKQIKKLLEQGEKTNLNSETVSLLRKFVKSAEKENLNAAKVASAVLANAGIIEPVIDNNIYIKLSSREKFDIATFVSKARNYALSLKLLSEEDYGNSERLTDLIFKDLVTKINKRYSSRGKVTKDILDNNEINMLVEQNGILDYLMFRANQRPILNTDGTPNKLKRALVLAMATFIDIVDFATTSGTKIDNYVETRTLVKEAVSEQIKEDSSCEEIFSYEKNSANKLAKFEGKELFKGE
jgi:hypothetical protein